ncbi:lysoplasmalogenase [Fangia hongkongensis]|uniref:lysoplasmalogenase n=2 Tax=Fangia hongkongensis TaxID=270495 RepID=UPI00037EDFB9|nr:lysoplasmalogenase [Fangia hongkongensis]
MLVYYTTLLILSALIHILTSSRKSGFIFAFFTFFKVLTTSLIILYVIFNAPNFSLYASLIVLGLCFSLFGDAFLLSQRYFTHGLVAFLIAHIFYIIGFYLLQTSYSLILILPILLYGVGFYCLLFSKLGNDKAAVAIYILIISIMGYLAINAFIGRSQSTESLIFAGAILFMLSDSILAWDKFKMPMKQATLWIMSTYYLAQWLIGLSVIY